MVTGSKYHHAARRPVPGVTGGLLMHEPPLSTLPRDDASTRRLAEEASEHLRLSSKR